MMQMVSAPPEIDRALLHALFRFNAALGAYRFIKGIDYVRCVELPLVAAEVLGAPGAGTAYLDVGSGDSILPAFVAMRSAFAVTVIDKWSSVWAQADYLRRLGRAEWLTTGRFVIHQADLLGTSAVGEAQFDVVTAVSALEHFEGDGDAAAVRRIYRSLKPGGRLLLTAPYNHDRSAEYFVPRAAYGTPPGRGGAFFQRHYSGDTLRRRVLDAAPFVVERLFYARHRGMNQFKRLWLLPPWLKPVKLFYNWAAPFYAPRFLRPSDEPPRDARPRMLTADTVFAYLRKPV